MLTLVPRQNIRQLFWFSLVWGAGADIFLILLLRHLNIFYYVNAAPLEFYGSPLLINLAWVPAMTLFLYHMPNRQEWYIYPLYLSIFGIFGTAIGVFLKNAGLIKEVHWNELLRFPVIIIWFHSANWHYKRLKNRDERMI